jgi:hypothetical protein
MVRRQGALRRQGAFVVCNSVCVCKARRPGAQAGCERRIRSLGKVRRVGTRQVT